MPAKVESISALPGLSPVCGKPIIARFDGGKLSSDGGVVALREIEARLSVANRSAASFAEPRRDIKRGGISDAAREHGLAEGGPPRPSRVARPGPWRDRTGAALQGRRRGRRARSVQRGCRCGPRR
ncbi:hypothetical protein EBZ70_09530 [bacterium]|nr:hypothetical protein [bacterium]